ncbi:putative transcription regulator (LysR family) [metagenome]|uniref:Putative transcription regulator (LysR family) n=1 Tax=metagenome TaxID=256318 RepID=A0A2P2CC18_9ZZZZ
MTTHVPDLPALRLLVGVARRGSIGAAARASGITQQAASERLRAVEAQVGLTLLQRGARGSRLTPAGVVLVEWAGQLLATADELDAAIEGLRADRGRDLNVSASMTIAETLLPRWLVQLRQRQEAGGLRATAVSLTATNSQQVAAAVLDGSAHVGFVEGLQAPGQLRSARIAVDELVLVASAASPLTRRRTAVIPLEVAGMALTSREAGSGTRQVVEAALARHGLTMAESTVELTTATAVREAVRAGSAPAFLSRRVVERDLASGQLAEVPTSGLELTRSFRAVWVGTASPPAGPARDLVAIARGDVRATV